ncbi:RNA polymerase sigma factor [Stackebrandtia nassauensis]|uniref:RNA polymerase sigma factor n=1 Tax=Stackebrandtia nassauensis TaxID=283811 RepID=UPI0001A3A051|nr:sigma-70 family RNA polymerase sigma factor [Stackebrandtia nassauensis]
MRLYASCRGWVLGRCRAQLAVHDAEDACAEVFTRAWRHLHSGKTIEHPLAWLATVTRHLIIDYRKRAARTPPSGDLACDFLPDMTPRDADTVHAGRCDPSPGPADLASVIDVTPVVRSWLAALPSQASAVVTGYLANEDPAATSNRLGCSVAAVRSSLYRARKHLRTRLAAHDLPCPPIRRC